MTTKKDNAKKALEEINLKIICEATAGQVKDNIDDVIDAVKLVLKRCDETNYLEAEADVVIHDRDLLTAIKTILATTVKEAKTVYNVPFAVIDAKCKALDLQVDNKAEVVGSVAMIHESAKNCSSRADLFSYFSRQAAWMGPVYGPIVWAKHPTSWDKATNMDKLRHEVDSLLFFVRTSFRIIHSWSSPFEDMLLMRFCELSDLKDALGIVHGYRQYLDSVVTVALTGGKTWDGWTPELLYFDEDPITEFFSVTGLRSEVEAAKVAISAMGARMDSAPNDGFEALEAWLRKSGFGRREADEVVADARALGCTLEDVRKLRLDPSMSVEEIEKKFFGGLE